MFIPGLIYSTLIIISSRGEKKRKKKNLILLESEMEPVTVNGRPGSVPVENF